MSNLRHIVTRSVNPVTVRFAGRVPGFAVLTHAGRSTGRTYRTPVNVFRRDGRFVFVLTYGSEAQWVQNVLAEGGCRIRTRGRAIELRDPELVVDPQRRLAPAPVRFIGRLGRVTEFLVMRVAKPETGTVRSPLPRPPRSTPAE